MTRILHVCWGLEPTNGAANIARMIMSEQAAQGQAVELKSWLSVGEIRSADAVCCHCGWYFGIWWAVFWAKMFGKRISWVPECCYDPFRLAYHGWKKRLVGPIERWALRQCDEVVATCDAEAAWVRAYEPCVRKIVVSDIRRFFKLAGAGSWSGRRGETVATTNNQPTTNNQQPTTNSRQPTTNNQQLTTNSRQPTTHNPSQPLKVLYLGREHPLKGTRFLKRAAEELGARVELRMASSVHGEEKESLWRWADVFVLPTLSDNFGLVVAEALERGVPVITTDGAPAWLDLTLPFGLCLKGYREGTPESRIQLLKDALIRFGA